MRRAPAVTATLVFFLAVAGATVAGSWRPAMAQGNAALHGAWIVTSRTSPAGEVNASPQRGLYMFTASGHYSVMYVTGAEPRPMLSGEGEFGTPTDAEKVIAFDNFVANSGRYSVDGDEIVYEAFMAKNPNYMAAFSMEDHTNSRRMRFSIEDGALTLYPIATDGTEPGGSVTLQRPMRQ